MSLAFRAYYALSPDIATSAGVVTNALHGFASMLATLVKAQKPHAVVVAFDVSGGTFRDELTEDYKGGRAETPEDLTEQFSMIRDFCEAVAIPVVGVEGFEADDVLATLASWGRDDQRPTIVVSGDRDTFQLVEDPFIRVLYNKRGVTDYVLYDEAGIFERCGVEPARYPLLAALRGDTSDNLPGVPGVGEKTAAKLLATYADFDALFSHLDDLTPKLRENLAANEQLARSNHNLMTLVRDVPLPIEPASLRMGGWRHAEVQAFFERFEMNAMRGRYETMMADGLFGDSEDAAERISAPVQELSRATSLAKALGKSEVAVVSTHADQAAACSPSGKSAWVGSLSELVTASANGPLRLAGHGVKAVYRAAGDTVIPDPIDDTEIMAFLVDSTSGAYELGAVAHRYLGEDVPGAGGALFEEVDEDAMRARVEQQRRLIDRLRAEVSALEVDFVYEEMELPLVRVLGRMEARGIHADRALLEKINQEFTEETARLVEQIQQLAGHEFKVNSPSQLQKVLFEELGLAPTKKIKSGYSTDAASLEAISGEHEIVPAILRFRELDKLRGTYGQSLIDTIGPDERIHATFHQTGARTGRLSSENPNLHNIPVRGHEGRRLRHAFGPEPGWRLLVADYNQIELRVIAHLSQDPGLLAAFRDSVDVHRSIAAVVFKIAPEDVSADQRERAKAVSYGLAYGMEAFGLSQRLGIPVSEAASVIKQYFDGFPTLRDYRNSVIAEITKLGYSRTQFGRVRPFPDLATSSGPQKAAAERQAVNAPIQGLAADIFKLALVRLDAALADAGLQSRLVLQVHDEVLVESPPAECDDVEKITLDALANAAELSVPLDVSMHWGDNWADAKG
jgi:DNA polymerase-1